MYHIENFTMLFYYTDHLVKLQINLTPLLIIWKTTIYCQKADFVLTIGDFDSIKYNTTPERAQLDSITSLYAMKHFI